MSFCLVIGTLFSFTGCSTINTDKNALNQKQVMKIGSRVLTKGDIVNSFYTYYQNNSNYFSYYDEATIEDSFYSWSIIREIISQKSKEALYNPETNTTGVIIYTEEDAKEVKDGAFDYIYNQISAYEKAIYQLAGVDSKKYPKWLQSETAGEDATSFESYESLKPEVEPKSTTDHTEKLSDDDILGLIPALKERLFQYVVSTDDEGDKTWADMEDYESEDVIDYARNEAYAQYMSYLVSNAKSNGKNKSADELFKEEFLRVYNAYYDSQITTMYQNYWLEEYMVDTVNGDTVSLSDKAIVRAYLENYFSDMEKYQIEENYVSVMTSKDGASLVLFNFDGKYYYFTVQHILVKYDDYMTGEIAKLEGYSSSNDYDAVVNDIYVAERNKLTDAYTMLTPVNEDTLEMFKDALVNDNAGEGVGDYYFYDEDLEKTAANNFGYVLLEKEVIEGQDDEDDVVKYYYSGTSVEFEGDVKEIKMMASEAQIISFYNTNFEHWKTLVNTYLTDETVRASYDETYASMAYVFEAALNLKTAGKTADEINEKVASLLWVELQWLYSSDSLGNKLSNKMGYVVSSMPDDNGSWVADFAIGAKAIMKDVIDNKAGKTSVIGATNVVTSNYGYHIIKIENVYEAGESLVDMTNFNHQMNVNDEEFVAEMVERLKSTYVCTSSNQTLYDYYYDTLYTELAGSSEASGTYFVALQYKWLAQYLNTDKVEYISKIGYQELMDSMS